MSFAGKWMRLETIILSKLKQEQKTNTTCKWVLNNENTWTQGWEHHTLGLLQGPRDVWQGVVWEVGEG